MALTTSILPALNDNYIFVLIDEVTREAAVVDPSEAEPVLVFIGGANLKLRMILNTHHHLDHIGGNLELKRATGAMIVAPAYDRHRIPEMDRAVQDGDTVEFGRHKAEVFFIPGHTSGHIAYYFAGERSLYCGDTLFSIGCGRLFEGTAEQMWTSLSRLRALPEDTKVYCAHEYTVANAAFALTVEPENKVLQSHLNEIKGLRARGVPSVPSTIGLEKQINPFLRVDQASVRATLAMPADANDVTTFAELRRRKDSFRS